MKVVKILAIVVVTSVVTVLCIRSGQAIVKAPAPAETIYQTTDDRPKTGHGNSSERDEGEPDRPEIRDPGRPYVGDPDRPYVGDPGDPEVIVDPGEPDVGDPGGLEVDGDSGERNVGDPGRLMANSSRSGDATEATGARESPTDDDPTPDDQVDGVNAATSRSLENDGRFGVGQSMSRGKAPPTAVRGKVMKQITPRPAEDDHDDDDDRPGVRDDEDSNDHEPNIILDAGMYHAANRPLYTGQTDHNGYSVVDTDTSAVAEEDSSTGYRQHSSYGGMTYNTGGEHLSDATGWNPAEQLGNEYGSTIARPTYGQPAVLPPYAYPLGYQSPSSSSPYYNRPRPLPLPNVNHNYNYVQPQHHQQHAVPIPMPMPPPLAALQQNNNYHHHHQQQQQQQQQYNAAHDDDGPFDRVQSALDKVDWHKVGTLALFKVGLAKLKLFAFLKLLFLLVFKLKLFLIAMFFKFLLLLKLMKFFKLLMVPLVLVALLPLIASLFSAPMLVGGLLSVPGRILDFLFGPVFVPSNSAAVAATKNAAVAAAAGGTAGVAGSAANTADVTTAKAGGGGGLFSAVVLSDRGPDDAAAYLMDRRRLQAMELFDPALSAFRKVLDSEKCVERIACRMAVVEKAGILPVWINWVLRRVSKYIPNGKLETYLKAYDDVNNEINIKSESPGNWAAWCSERYDCNTTANFTINVDSVLTDVKQQ